jgi:hypothetical protein
MPAEAVQSFIRYATGGIRAKMQFRIHDSLVTRSRNVLTRDFLDSGCDKLLFLDSDLLFEPEHIARIASHDRDIVGGMYAIKKDGPDLRWCANGLKEGPPEAGPDGLMPVAYVGTGFCCVKREVFLKMIETGLAPEYRADGSGRLEHDFWQVGVYEYKDGRPRRYLSEDWMFCQLALDLGYKVWLDCAVMLGHVGAATWPLSHHKVETVALNPSGINSALPK